MDAPELNDRLSRISTQWTMILRAHGGPGDGPDAARAELMQRYCGAVYRYLLGVVHDPAVFTAVMALDNFAQAFAGVALVAYMSSLTSLGYTATQYALLSSTYAFLGKFLKGFSGAVVDGLSVTHGLIGAYQIAWIATGLTAIPPILLFLLLARLQRDRAAARA